MKERTETSTTGRKLKKLLIVAMLVCYVPLTSGCVQYVMLAMMVVQGVSGMVAQQREAKGRREAAAKGEPYVRDAATSNWGTASSLAGLGASVTSFGANTGMWGQGAAAANSGQQGNGASESINPDTGKPMSQGNSVANGGQQVKLNGQSGQSAQSGTTINNASYNGPGQNAGTNNQNNVSGATSVATPEELDPEGMCLIDPVQQAEMDLLAEQQKNSAATSSVDPGTAGNSQGGQTAAEAAEAASIGNELGEVF
jgi:hypothetical protein